ncbi:MAG: PSD1 and planctomycete cytochrome C domain-containing protein [Planctomycetaceae bacterium]
MATSPPILPLAVIAVLALWGIASRCRSAEPAPKLALAPHEAAFFETKIRPLFAKYCYDCHAADSKKLGGGLLLDSRDGTRKGGDSGSAVEPGKPDESLLIIAVRYEDESLKMPPKGKLPDAAIADLEAWVKLGAPDPRDDVRRPPSGGAWDEALRSRRGWWSLQPVRNPPVPDAPLVPRADHPVDRFIFAKLAEHQLAPAGPADARTLIRRLSLVLTGLPPTAEQVSAFIDDCRETLAGAATGDSGAPAPRQAVERLVDALLESPHFGERWARHWLDVVRFSETHGNEWNYEVHHAWRYRDYLIRAFNNDVPYDQLVREHIAGDLLPQPRWNEQERFNESIIGTAFYRFGEVPHDDCIGLPQIGYDILDNQIDTLTKAFQATTVACARCHDHKIDAVSMQDYYGLLGILRSSRLVSHTIDAPDVNAAAIERLVSLKDQVRRELAEIWMQEAGLVGRYLLAAESTRNDRLEAMTLRGLDPERVEKWIAALADEKVPFENPLSLWRMLSAVVVAEGASLPEEWRKLQQQYAKEDRERTDFNRDGFEMYADFRGGAVDDWQVGGQGLRSGPTKSGELVLCGEGDTVVGAVLPAGFFTHSVSDKLNGVLRSPPLPKGRKRISFEVLGQRSSAVRLVANNCQLNYRNYRALTSGNLQWVTFSPPENRDSLRVFAELMTKFDNPKFPDQLSSLGGDPTNYRVPWEKAAENPRSYFGMTRVVLHDGPDPPRIELTHLRPLFAGDPPTDLAAVAQRYAAQVKNAIRAWGAGLATDDDVRWLDMLIDRGLVSNSLAAAPGLTQLVAEFRSVEQRLRLPRIIPGIADFGSGFDQPILVRGECANPGEATPRRYLEVLSQASQPLIPTGSGRLQLSEWIVSADNPFTARVIVNRIWHHLFGTGLVRTVDDFGHVGELPSHPELLDYLASRFIEEGWSVKRLIRSLVLTNAFQRSNEPSAAAREIDPQNRLLQHYPARRMEAEAVRDAILCVSGRLDGALFGPSISPHRDGENADRRLFPGPLDGHGRRSIYIKNSLMEAPKFLEAFNFPGGKVTQGRRDQTNVPAQALALLNDPFVIEQAGVWARSLVARPDESVELRIDVMFIVGLGRSARIAELDCFTRAVRQLAELYQVPSGEVMASEAVWKDVAHAMFNLKEFIFVP